MLLLEKLVEVDQSWKCRLRPMSNPVEFSDWRFNIRMIGIDVKRRQILSRERRYTFNNPSLLSMASVLLYWKPNMKYENTAAVNFKFLKSFSFWKAINHNNNWLKQLLFLVDHWWCRNGVWCVMCEMMFRWYLTSHISHLTCILERGSRWGFSWLLFIQNTNLTSELYMMSCEVFSTTWNNRFERIWGGSHDKTRIFYARIGEVKWQSINITWKGYANHGKQGRILVATGGLFERSSSWFMVGFIKNSFHWCNLR